jgi:hypothetical protein
LARHDEACGTRSDVAAAEEFAGGDDYNEQRKNRYQIDVPGIVTPMADFPAH